MSILQRRKLRRSYLIGECVKSPLGVAFRPAIGPALRQSARERRRLALLQGWQ
jgi:hypothetical protein